MSYDPSHRMPPRQDRWPQATPAEGWPSYQDPEGEQADRRPGADRLDAYAAADGYRRQAGYQHASAGSGDRGQQSAVVTAAFPAAGNGYGASGGYGPAGYGDARDSYAGGINGYTRTDDGYAGATDDFAGTPGGYSSAGNGYGSAGNGHAGVSNGYAGAAGGYAGTIDGYAGTADGFDGAVDGYTRTDDGYTRTDDGYGRTDDGYGRTDDGYGRAADEVNGYDWNATGYAGAADGTQDGFAGGAYLGPGSYTEPGYTEPGLDDLMLRAPDAGIYPDHWQAEQERRRESRRRGLMVGAVTELLATGVVIGVSTLAAALLKAQTSPVSAMGAVFVARTPAALRNVATQHFGSHGGTVLLLGMYATFAVVAIVIGGLARRATALGVAGLGAFTLFAAFATITGPASHVGDVTPAIVGGIAGVAALLWLFRASAPVAPPRQARGGRRRAR